MLVALLLFWGQCCAPSDKHVGWRSDFFAPCLHKIESRNWWEKGMTANCKMTATQLTSVSVVVLNFAFCNAISIFITFALNVEQAFLLARFEHVLVWSKMCTVQNLVGITKLTPFKKQRRLLINPTSILPPPTYQCKFKNTELLWKFQI